MHPSPPTPRLPGRTRRQRLTVAGIALAICMAFWLAIGTSQRRLDPRLLERVVPVKIVPAPPAEGVGVSPDVPAGRSASGAVAR